MCASCSAPVPDGARFCPSCGVPQQLDAVRDDERRVVTVVFADLVGFTTLSEHRDPESVKRLVDRIFEQLVRDVEAHGGVVDKMLGDGMIALFGAPVAHEDDADRAVRAALAMQQSVGALGAVDPTEPVRMRVGINTGEVLMGTLAGTDYTAMGDVVNTASRLQEIAPPGTVLVGQATRELCSAVIRLEPVERVRLRGREQETTAWRAVAVDTANVPRRWRSDVPFVGRASELATLRGIVERLLAGRGAIVSISGEAGIGKSRLVDEVVRSLTTRRPDTLVMEGACAPYGEPNVWWPITGGLVARMGLDRTDDPDSLRPRIERRLTATKDFVADSPELERAVEIVLHLLGQPSALDDLSPTGARDAVAGTLVKSLRRRAEVAPVVVWIDDIQWAAPLLLDLLETVARQLAGLPLLIVTTCRPTEATGDGDWPPPVDPVVTLHLSLDALRAAEAGVLARRATDGDLADDVVDTIILRSGGNPLFLIELARLAASGGQASPSDLPGSLRALIAARLDELTTPQRQIVDNAAIIGNEGLIESLRNFAAEVGQGFDRSDLDAVEALGLMLVDRRRWTFRSDVVREVAYQTLTKESRAQRHAGVAGYLARHEPTLVDRRAHHSASAAELRRELGSIDGVPDDIAVVAARLLIDAASGWVDQGAHRRALGQVERALGLGVEEPDVHARLLAMRAEALVDLHETKPARRRVAELASFAQETGDRVLLGESERLSGQIEQSAGDLVAARRHLAAAVGVFRDIGDDARLAEALRARGFVELFGGSLSDGDRFLDEAERLFIDLGDRRGIAWVWQHRGWVSFLAGDHERSERRLRTAITAFTRLEDRAGAAWSEGLLAYVFHFMRRNDEALASAANVLDDAVEWGDEWAASMMRNLQASIWLWQGRMDDAIDAAERALSGFQDIDDRFGIVQVLSTLTRAYVAVGRSAQADRSVEEILTLADAFGEMGFPVIAAAGTAMHQGDGRRAVELGTEGEARLDTTGTNVDEVRVITAFGHLLAGDADSALARLVDVDVEGSPFALAARSTAAVLIGDVEQAAADASLVDDFDGASYWDRTIARVAGVAAAEGDERNRRRRALLADVADLDDVVLRSYVAAALGADGPTDPPPPGGWATIAAGLAARL